METYFFDTYAFFEIIKGNPNYGKFQETKAVTTIFNLMELSFGIRKKSTLEEAENYVKQYAPLLTDVKPEDIVKATQLKFENRKLSSADTIGYIVARRISVNFLTGDKEFRHMKNVEFVK